MLTVINLVKDGKLELVDSSIIEYENSIYPFPERMLFILEVMKLAGSYQNIDEEIYERARAIEHKMRIPPIDSLHIAAAEAAKVDYFITCDYTIIKRCGVDKGGMRVITPLEFITQYESRHRK